MKASRLFGAAAALAGAVLAWQVLKPLDDDRAQAMGSPVPVPAQAVSSRPAAARSGAATPSVIAEQAPRAAGGPAATPSLAAALREGLQSANYRQYIHQALTQPSPVGIRVAMELSSLCGLIKVVKANPPPRPVRLAPDLAAELQRRTQACEQSNGPDLQQLRALSAAKKRAFDSADAFLMYGPFKGTREELAALYRLGDAGGMANWGLASTPEHMELLAGDEPVFFRQSSLSAIHAAWQAAVCERFGCDDFNARIVRCRDDASCQMSLQDILKEHAGVDDATWQRLLAAARRRLDALLPG